MGMGINNQLSVNQHINEISASEDFSITKAVMLFVGVVCGVPCVLCPCLCSLRLHNTHITSVNLSPARAQS